MRFHIITSEQWSFSFADNVPLASGDLNLVRQNLVENVVRKLL